MSSSKRLLRSCPVKSKVEEWDCGSPLGGQLVEPGEQNRGTGSKNLLISEIEDVYDTLFSTLSSPALRRPSVIIIIITGEKCLTCDNGASIYSKSRMPDLIQVQFSNSFPIFTK
jgi:hypothetical protein